MILISAMTRDRVIGRGARFAGHRIRRLFLEVEDVGRRHDAHFVALLLIA